MSNINLICHVFVTIFSNPGSIPIKNLKWSIFSRYTRPKSNHFNLFFWWKPMHFFILLFYLTKKKHRNKFESICVTLILSTKPIISPFKVLRSPSTLCQNLGVKKEENIEWMWSVWAHGDGDFYHGRRGRSPTDCVAFICFVLRYFSALGSGVYPIISRLDALSSATHFLCQLKKKHFLVWLLLK